MSGYCEDCGNTLCVCPLEPHDYELRLQAKDAEIEKLKGEKMLAVMDALKTINALHAHANALDKIACQLAEKASAYLQDDLDNHAFGTVEELPKNEKEIGWTEDCNAYQLGRALAAFKKFKSPNESDEGEK